MTPYRIAASVHALSDPLAIFHSVNRDKKIVENQYVALVDVTDKDGSFISVPVHMMVETENVNVEIAEDVIASVYGRGDWQYINWVDNGFLVYINKEAIDGVASRVIRQSLNTSMACNSNVLTRSFIFKFK